jgi:hypothetical protein
MHGQRSLKNPRVAILLDALHTGHWRPCNMIIVGVGPNEEGRVVAQMQNGQHTAHAAARDAKFSAAMAYMFVERHSFRELQDDYAAADALPGRTKMDKLGALAPDMIEQLNNEAEQMYATDPTLQKDRVGLPARKKRGGAEQPQAYFTETDRGRFLLWMAFLLTRGSRAMEDRAAAADPHRQLEALRQYLREYLIYRAHAMRVNQKRANLVNINPFAGPVLFFLKKDRPIAEELMENIVMEFADEDSEDPMAKTLVEWLVDNCSEYAGGSKWAARVMAATVATFACAIQGDQVPDLDRYTDASAPTCADAIEGFMEPFE